MRQCVILCYVLGVLGMLPARANLGETVPQLVQRYGQPTGYAEAGPNAPFARILFRAGGYELVIFVLKDTEVGARVAKLDKTNLSAAEMQTIMEADTNHMSWIPARTGDPAVLAWERADHAEATYDKNRRMLLFTTPVMANGLHPSSETPAAAPIAPPAPAP